MFFCWVALLAACCAVTWALSDVAHAVWAVVTGIRSPPTRVLLG